MKNTLVISAFPTMGKTHFFNNNPEYTMLDSDSSMFSWIKDEQGNNTDVRNPSFIDDYMKHIKENIGKCDIIFVSSHKEVREALQKQNIKYFLVVPTIEMKEEVIGRMKSRGNDEKFINFISNNYEKFLEEIDAEFFPNRKLVKLSSGFIDSWLIKVLYDRSIFDDMSKL